MVLFMTNSYQNQPLHDNCFFYNRLLSKLALVDKIWDFCADLLQNFESMCIHLALKILQQRCQKA